jgi:hypothetical protein
VIYHLPTSRFRKKRQQPGVFSGLKSGDPLYGTARAAQAFAVAAKSAATMCAHKSDSNDFATWCHTNSPVALPAEPATVAM